MVYGFLLSNIHAEPKVLLLPPVLSTCFISGPNDIKK
jgi:hypothetical protein